MIQDEAEDTGIAVATPRLSNEVMGHYGGLNIPKSWSDGYIRIQDEADNIGIVQLDKLLSSVMPLSNCQ